MDIIGCDFHTRYQQIAMGGRLGHCVELPTAPLPIFRMIRQSTRQGIGAEESSNIGLWSREESRQVNCFAAAQPGNAGERAGAWSGLGASRIRDFHSLFRWLPKLDRIAIWIFKPREDPHGGIFLGLFDYHAFTLKMAEDFSHVLHCVINLTRSRLILDVLIRVHNRPSYRSLDLRVCKIPIFERCID